jgi:small conductance mechanosensitive channel
VRAAIAAEATEFAGLRLGARVAQRGAPDAQELEMDPKNIAHLQEVLTTSVIDIAVKILAAFVFWVIRRWLIGAAVRLLQSAHQRQKVDPTLLRYAGSVVTVTLNIILAVGILGYLGVQTTTLAALFAAAGVAIGMAWSGRLAHFAAGAFLIVLRPFKTGDFITIGGVTGTVREGGLFATVLDTPDNLANAVLKHDLAEFPAPMAAQSVHVRQVA